MNRTDRLTAIIIYLQGRNRVTVDDLAERYEISRRTVYRDLRALQEAGVPIGSEAGEGYFIVRGYHLPPVMFDREEAAALLAGERLMRRWNNTELGRSYVSALDKIRAILPPDKKEYFETLDRHVKAFPYRNHNEPLPDERIFAFLQNAIVDRTVIAIDYYSPYKQERTHREVEPLGLLLMGRYWYLAGWCRLREDYRMFRLDRFEEYRLTGMRLPDPADHSLQEFYDRNLQEEENLTEVTVRFDEEIVRYVGDQKYWHGWAWEEPVEGGVEMTFLVSWPEYISRWLLTWGDGIRVIGPDRVRDRVAELAGELFRHHCGEK